MSVAEHAEPTGIGRATVVLVVEDDEDCRETICDTLTDAGYVVHEASDGEDALRFLLDESTTDPEIIVLDLWLPGMSGRDVLKALKGHARLSRIPVVLTSAGRPCGADNEPETEWLAKPFDAEHLLAAVNAHACVRPSQVELRKPAI